MTEIETRKALLKRIQALSSKTVDNGCTEAEALSAAALMAKLVDKYGFTPEDMSEPEEKVIEAKTRTTAKMRGKIFFINAVADYCDCKSFRVNGHDYKELVFFGKETDVLMANYLLDLLGVANDGAYKAFMKADRKDGRRKTSSEINADRRAFDLAMAGRVGKRLREMKAERNAAVDETSGQKGGALVIVKNAVVTEAFAKAYPNVRTGRDVNGGKVGAAARAGYAAGDAVNITTGIGAKTQIRIA